MRDNIVKVGRSLTSALPYGGWGDRLYHLAYFMYAHGRLPRRNSGLINDYFYFLKTSSEIECAERQFCSDKALVKMFVRSVVGESYVAKTLALLRTEEEIEKFVPNQKCVLKPTHLTGTVVFAEEATPLSDQERQLLKSALVRNLYMEGRERNYANLKPRIIVEERLGSEEINDYKIFCFKGRPRFIVVDSDRFSGHKRSLHYVDWSDVGVRWNYPLGAKQPRPEHLSAMLGAAESVSRYFESVRVDFYSVDDRIIIGELTSTPDRGHGTFESLADERLVSQIYFASGSQRAEYDSLKVAHHEGASAG